MSVFCAIRMPTGWPVRIIAAGVASAVVMLGSSGNIHLQFAAVATVALSALMVAMGPQYR